MDPKLQIQDWVIKGYAACGLFDPPFHLVKHYVNKISKQKLSFQQVQEEIIIFSRGKVGVVPTPSTQPNNNTSSSVQNKPSAPPGPISTEFQKQEEEKQRLQSQIGTLPVSEKDKFKEYIDSLYVHYTGKKGDPASTNFLLNSLLDKSYSLQQAEFFVQFSKEAKLYNKEKEAEMQKKQQNKEQQVLEYVRELYRVYLKNNKPNEEDVKDFADSILDGSRTFQDVEDEVKLLSLSPPK